MRLDQWTGILYLLTAKGSEGSPKVGPHVALGVVQCFVAKSQQTVALSPTLLFIVFGPSLDVQGGAGWLYRGQESWEPWLVSVLNVERCNVELWPPCILNFKGCILGVMNSSPACISPSMTVLQRYSTRMIQAIATPASWMNTHKLSCLTYGELQRC